MDILKKYSISFKRLGSGKHHFGFDVDNRFFRVFEGSEITKGRVHADVEFTRSGNIISLHIAIRGEVTVECDRCLEELTLPVDYEGDVAVKASETEAESDGDIIWISPGDTEINLAQYIYESIWLSLPAQRIHSEDKNGKSLCNPEMLERFRIVSEGEFGQLS